MKIVKRDGRVVDYDRNKIIKAIEKANRELPFSEQIIEKDIEKIINFIENLKKERMLVEDIQDIIEAKLMEYGKYTLAKKYIIYRYTRSIIRKSNTTDATILSLLKSNVSNSEKCLTPNEQRNMMAGEASKDLSMRLLLPENVTKLIKEDLIKFNHLEYFTESIIEDCYIDLKSMLKKYTVINNIKIDRPKSFQSACNVLIEIIASVASSITGNIYVNLKDLFEFYLPTYNKKYELFKTLLNNNLSEEEIIALSKNQSFIEIKSGIQTIIYQLNTLITTDGKTPKVNFIIDTNDINEDIEENIINELINQKREGLINYDGTQSIALYPKFIYVINNNNSKKDKKYYYITEEMFNINSNTLYVNENYYKEFIKRIAKFNQGTITIKMQELINYSDQNNINLLELFENTLDTCYEGFLCKNHNLQGTYSNKCPILWIYGGISKMNYNERIDKLLKKEYSFMTLNIIDFEKSLSKLRDKEKIKEAICKSLNQFIKNTIKNNYFEIHLSNWNNNLENIDSLKFINDLYYTSDLLFCVLETKDIDKMIFNVLNNNVLFQKK